jgi:hypothetical protein
VSSDPGDVPLDWSGDPAESRRLADRELLGVDAAARHD